jgi:hypothetical protein
VPEPTLQITTDKRSYVPGEPIEIDIQIDRESYLYLYDIDPAGTVTLLYPNRFQPDPQVSAGRLHLPGEGYRLVIGTPEGVETLVALASSVPLPELTAPAKGTFRQMEESPEVFAQGLETELDEAEWTSAWTQFTVYRPKAVVHIDSQPTHARILIDGRLRGYTPKELVLPAGEVTIALEKPGYERFSETVVLHDQETFDFEARLQEVLPSPSLSGMEVSFAFLGVDLGVDSVGFEVGLTRTIGLAGSLQFTGEDPPPLGGLYNLGPEMGIDLRIHAPLTEAFSALLGAGIALQNRTTSPATPAGLSPLIITIEPITATDLFPSFMLGMQLSVGHANVLAGYHLRRGFIVGVELLFAR